MFVTVGQVRALSAVVVAGIPFPGTASSAFIGSPSRNMICQINRSAADCIVFSRKQEAVVTNHGHVGIAAQHADVGENPLRILRYGQSVAFGTLHCTSLSSGMRCVHRPSRHGFKAAREGIRRF